MSVQRYEGRDILFGDTSLSQYSYFPFKFLDEMVLMWVTSYVFMDKYG